jgi:hypothetical protein
MAAARADYREDKARKFILDNQDRPWSWSALSRNRAVNLDLVRRLLHKPWSWAHLSTNPGISWSDILASPDLPWDWDQISKWASLSMVLQHPDRPWVWPQLSMSKHISLPEILAHPNLPWDMLYVRFAHPTDSTDIGDSPALGPLHESQLTEHMWQCMSRSEDLDAEYVTTHIDRPWNFSDLCNHHSIKHELLDTIRRFPDKPWDWFSLSYCNLTRMPTPEWDAAIVIQRWWLRLYYHPDAHVCRQRLLREHSQLTQAIRRNRPNKRLRLTLPV